MFEKFYKSAVITLAVFLIGLTFYIIISPSKAVSQITPSVTTNYVIPETHVWEVSTVNNNNCCILFNKKSGECYRIWGDRFDKLK